MQMVLTQEAAKRSHTSTRREASATTQAFATASLSVACCARTRNNRRGRTSSRRSCSRYVAQINGNRANDRWFWVLRDQCVVLEIERYCSLSQLLFNINSHFFPSLERNHGQAKHNNF